MRRILRSAVALFAAYGILFAAVFAAIESSPAGAFHASAYCNASALGDPAPFAPVRHDLDCCIVCLARAAGIAPPETMPAAASPLFRSVAWPATTLNFVRLASAISPPARAPPFRA